MLVRSGELALKYGPSVWAGVTSSASLHSGVGANVVAGAEVVAGAAVAAVVGVEAAGAGVVVDAAWAAGAP
jgi:hypothetical protein